MSGHHRGGGRPSPNGDLPGMAARGGRGVSWIKKPGQAAGRGQPVSSSSSNWNSNGGSSGPPRNNWAVPSDRRPAARDNPRPPSQTNSRQPERQAVPNPVVAPPLASVWQQRPRLSGPESSKVDVSSSSFDPETDSSDVEDSSDDDMSDDDDSDASAKSFRTRKNNKWFKSFFEEINTLTVEQVLEPTKPWHCPACKNGPGAIDWFKGLQSLVTHASTKGSRRVKLHRELASLLEEEMSGRGTTVVPSGEQFGQWTGLRVATDREIVWPPMVIVMNTLLEKDEADKWLGMGNQELLDYFSEYDASKARHAYGPGGHRGMSVLIFESSAVGYMEAERLHKHFVDQRADREAWQTKKARFLPGGKRQLYGFLANKEDMEYFNQHNQGKSRLKYDMRSHNEMVVVQLKQMSEANQQLHYMKNKMVKEKQHSKVVEGSFGAIAQKYREIMKDKEVLLRRVKEKHLEYEEEMKSQEKFFNDQLENFQKAMEEKDAQKYQETMEDKKVLMRRFNEKHLEYEEEMKSQEKFFNDQLENIKKTMENKECEFEKLLQEERAKARLCDVDSGTTEHCTIRKEQVERFIDCQVKDVEAFEAKRDEAIKAHEEKKKHLKEEYMTKEVELEKELDATLTALMEEHKPDTFQASSS
ncbi:unnamed protein product [Alopecurus aequalis]